MATFRILQETGDALLQETGDYLLLDTEPIYDYSVVSQILGTTELRTKMTSRELKTLISAVELLSKSSTRKIS